jgi:hypothetical protein
MTEVDETKCDNDQWDMLDNDSYWLPLPATTADEYLSGETPSIFINRDDGRWWVSVSRENGALVYEKLEGAKAAGDSVIQQYYADQLADITADLGVSPDEWEVTLGDEYISVKSRNDGDIEIFGGSDGRWSFDGSVSAKSSDFSRILDIATKEIKSSPAQQ